MFPHHPPEPPRSSPPEVNYDDRIDPSVTGVHALNVGSGVRTSVLEVAIPAHDLAVIRHICDRVAVMYAGLIVEFGKVREIYNNPRHPYTEALMSSIPRLHNETDKLTTIEGAPPSLVMEVSTCPFEPRCKYRIDRCAEEMPLLTELSPGHACACWVAQEGGLKHV